MIKRYTTTWFRRYDFKTILNNHIWQMNIELLNFRSIKGWLFHEYHISLKGGKKDLEIAKISLNLEEVK